MSCMLHQYLNLKICVDHNSPNVKQLKLIANNPRYQLKKLYDLLLNIIKLSNIIKLIYFNEKLKIKWTQKISSIDI
jgi:hypothetical protein